MGRDFRLPTIAVAVAEVLEAFSGLRVRARPKIENREQKTHRDRTALQAQDQVIVRTWAALRASGKCYAPTKNRPKVGHYNGKGRWHKGQRYMKRDSLLRFGGMC